MAGGAAMLTQAVESYMAVRRACGLPSSRREPLLRIRRLLGRERQKSRSYRYRHRVGRIGSLGSQRARRLEYHSICPLYSCRGRPP